MTDEQPRGFKIKERRVEDGPEATPAPAAAQQPTAAPSASAAPVAQPPTPPVAKTSIVRVTTGLATFECPTCKFVHKATHATDPEFLDALGSGVNVKTECGKCKGAMIVPGVSPIQVAPAVPTLPGLPDNRAQRRAMQARRR